MKTEVECDYPEVPAEVKVKSEEDDGVPMCLAGTDEEKKACCLAAIVFLGNLVVTSPVADIEGCSGIAGVAVSGGLFDL